VRGDLRDGEGVAHRARLRKHTPWVRSCGRKQRMQDLTPARRYFAFAFLALGFLPLAVLPFSAGSPR
jgi:hypothetical protein